MYLIYLLINEAKTKSYVGLTDSIEQRINDHRLKKVKTTKNFGTFKYSILEKGIPLKWQARDRERYWKSCVGRKKIKNLFI